MPGNEVWKYKPDDQSQTLVSAGFFDTYAQNLDRFRPGYPAEVIDTLVELAGISPDDKVCEIGAGTGKPTRALAERGVCIDAVEPGDDLRAIGEERTRRFPNVRWIASSFEAAELPRGYYQAVLAAQALHWVREPERFGKTREILKPLGNLALLWTVPIINEESRDFFGRADAIARGYNDTFEVPRRKDVGIIPEIDQTQFHPARFLVFDAALPYTGSEFAGYFSTMSDFGKVDPKLRAPYLESLVRMVEDEYDGSVNIPWIFTLAVARARANVPAMPQV